MTRSATMVQFHLEADTLALFPHYGDAISRHQWDSEIRPWLECALEQMPVSAYLADPGFLPRPDSIARPVSPAVVAGLAAAGANLESCLSSTVVAELSSSISLVETADESSDRTVVASTISLPTLTALGVAKTRSLITSLDHLVETGQLRAYALVRDKPLAQCSDCLQLLMAIPVPATIDRALFPPLQVAR